MVPPRTRPSEDPFENEEPKAEGWSDEETDELDEEAEPDFSAVEDEEEEEAEEEAEAFEEEAYEEGEEEGEEADEEALDELEAEELDMLTEDEAAESLPVDEVEELRHLRREAIELELGPSAVGEDEFVCSGCFLVKRITQLADKRKKLCRDCV
jgi:flagellar biosynthesis/type III secretory pathway protein FliH